jgi:hypothetical protein
VKLRSHRRDPARSRAWLQDTSPRWLKALKPNETNLTLPSERDGVYQRFWTTVQIVLWYLVKVGERGSGFVELLAHVADRLHSQAQQLPQQQPRQQEVRAPRKQFVDHLTWLRRKMRYDQRLQEQAGVLENTEDPADKLSGQLAGKLEDTVVVEKEKVETQEDTGKPPVQLFEEELGFPEDIEGPADKLAGQQAERLEDTVVGPAELLGNIEEPAGGVELQRRHTEEHTGEPAEEAVHKLVELRPDSPARMQVEVLQHILEVEELGQQADKLAGTQVASDMQAVGMQTDNLWHPLLRKHLQIPSLAVHLLNQRNLARMATALQHMPGALRSRAVADIALRSQEDHTPRTCLGHSPSVAACTFLAAAAVAAAGKL